MKAVRTTSKATACVSGWSSARTSKGWREFLLWCGWLLKGDGCVMDNNERMQKA